ncbi:MAG: hypothetical protein ABH859_00910 [Pseudomonadota bacterium]
MKKMKPEIIEKIKNKEKEKPCAAQIPLYLPENTLQNHESSESKEKQEKSRVITIDLV